MIKAELEELKVKVPCATVLETAGFALDAKESTRRAMKYRRETSIIIVIHGGKGWFDPLGEAKGDVFRLVEHLQGVPFVDAMNDVASLVGFVPSEPVWQREPREREPDLSITERWQARRKPWRGSATWRYLTENRQLPDGIVRAAIGAGVLREGPHGSMWAAHRDEVGSVTGWEERGPDWRGFATGGAKVLFRLGTSYARRLCVTEAAIDAMSLAALEGLRTDTLYLSTGGGWSRATDAAIRALASRTDVQLVAATDNNKQGEVSGRARRQVWLQRRTAASYGGRLERRFEDEDGERRRVGGKPSAACPPVASRVKLRPASPALDPPGRSGGRGEGSGRAEEKGDP